MSEYNSNVDVQRIAEIMKHIRFQLDMIENLIQNRLFQENVSDREHASVD